MRRSLSAWWLLAPLLMGAGLVFFLTWGRSTVDLATPALGDLPVSLVTVHVSYDLSDLAAELEGELPLRFGDLAARQRYPADERLEYAYEAERGALELTASGDTVYVATTLRYGGQVWLDTPLGVELTASCGVEAGDLAAGAPRATIGLSFPIAVDEDWTVRSAPSVDVVEPLSEDDRCRAVVLQFTTDATDPILASLRVWLEDEVERTGARIESLDPRERAAEWWETAGNPIPLAQDVWLVLNPSSLGYQFASGVGTGEGTLDGRIFATVQPGVVLGARPGVRRRDLPALSAVRAAEGEWVEVEGRAELEAVSELLAQRIEGQAWRGFGLSAAVQSAELSGTPEGRAQVALQLEGSVTARVIVIGTPILDADTGELTVPDLDFSIENGGPVARAVGWTLHTFFLGALRQNTGWRLDELVTPGLDREVEMPLSDQATLRASVAEAELTDVAIVGRELVLRARARPSAFLRIGS